MATVVIDPILHRVGRQGATDWIRPWPGTDAALGLAMLKTIVDEKLYDEEFLLAPPAPPVWLTRPRRAGDGRS